MPAGGEVFHSVPKQRLRFQSKDEPFQLKPSVQRVFSLLLPVLPVAIQRVELLPEPPEGKGTDTLSPGSPTSSASLLPLEALNALNPLPEPSSPPENVEDEDKFLTFQSAEGWQPSACQPPASSAP